MSKVISGNIKIEVHVRHEIIAECKLEVLSFHILSAWVKHQMTVDVNIQGHSYAKKSEHAQNSQCIQNSIFPSGKHIFPSYIFDKFFS